MQQPLVDAYWRERAFPGERCEAIADALSHLLGKHLNLEANPREIARMENQIAFTRAARTRRPTDLRGNPLQYRARRTDWHGTRDVDFCFEDRHGHGI